MSCSCSCSCWQGAGAVQRPATAATATSHQAAPATIHQTVPRQLARALPHAALGCRTVVGKGTEHQGRSTVQEVIARLGAMVIVHSSGIVDGIITGAEDRLLFGASVDLGANWIRGRLTKDALKYKTAEQNYDPSGRVRTTYAQALMQSIQALEYDCPGSLPEAKKLAGV